MDTKQLIHHTRHAAALRRIQRLQPAGGPGDTVFPPTYPGNSRTDPPRHVYGARSRTGGSSYATNGSDANFVTTVLVDSVQSQANRLEEALQAAADEGLPLPFVTVDFGDCDLEPLTRITSLQAPHRVYDAILRDSLLNGKPFMESDAGRDLAKSQISDATALLEMSPNALLFGAWHSQGQGGGLGAKFARAIVSEIVGVNVPVEEATHRNSGEAEPRTKGRRTGSRVDPLGIRKGVEVFMTPKTKEWGMTRAEAGKGAMKKKPSEINHGNIAPTIQSLGVTFDYAEHRTVITFAGLRRLRFGSPERNDAGRALLAALGLVAALEQDRRGYALRSRCDLVCEGRSDFEVVHADGATEPVTLDLAGAHDLYREAFAGGEAAGFSFRSLTLTPQEKLVAIVRQSRALALAGRGSDGGEN